MDAERILNVGERGMHLLFDQSAIADAFAADPDRLRDVVMRRRREIETALGEILSLDRAEQARALIAELPPELRHVLVLLYFELLERRIARRRPVLH
jgi:hypothetical protein